MIQPTLPDLPALHTYPPGSKILVFVGCQITYEQTQKVCRMIDKWAQNPMNTLVLDVSYFSICWKRGAEVLLQQEAGLAEAPKLGTIDLKCKPMDFKDGDTLIITGRDGMQGMPDRFKKHIEQWTGPGVEVILPISRSIAV